MVGDRIKFLREGLNQSQEELASAIGMHSNTVARWERGELAPRGTSLSKLAQALNTSTGYLLGETDDPAPNPSRSTPPALPESNVRETEIVWVPVVSSEVKACCGMGNLYPEEVTWEEIGRYPIPFANLAGYGWQIGTNGIRIFTVEGDSMEPRIEDGDKILFADVRPLSGDVAVIMYMGRLLVRGITFESKQVRLTAFNPDYSEIIVPISKGIDALCILGKVIATVKISLMRGRMW